MAMVWAGSSANVIGSCTSGTLSYSYEANILGSEQPVQRVLYHLEALVKHVARAPLKEAWQPIYLLLGLNILRSVNLLRPVKAVGRAHSLAKACLAWHGRSTQR